MLCVTLPKSTPTPVYERPQSGHGPVLEDVGDPGSPDYVLASLDTSLPPAPQTVDVDASVQLNDSDLASAIHVKHNRDAPMTPSRGGDPLNNSARLSIAERSAIKAAEYAARREARAELMVLKDMQNATFKPKINAAKPNKHSTVGDDRDSAKRLYEDAKERAIRIEARRLEQEIDSPSIVSRPTRHHDPSHVDRLLAWEQDRRAKLHDASRAKEEDMVASLTPKPAIDPVSRALALSQGSARTSRTTSPTPHTSARGTPVIMSPVVSTIHDSIKLNSTQKEAMVDRLYYQDAEVKRLERQLAEVRAAKESRRSHTPTLTRHTAILAGTTIPCQSTVYDRLAKEAVRVEHRRAERSKAAAEELKDNANVGHYLGTMTHLLGTIAKQKRDSGLDSPAKRPCGTKDGAIPKQSFSPSINPHSRSIDESKCEAKGPLSRVELLLQKGEKSALQRERLRLQRERDEADRLAAERLATARMLAQRTQRATGCSSEKASSDLSFEERQRLWSANRNTLNQRRRAEAQALQESILRNECTFTPRTLKRHAQQQHLASHAAMGSENRSLSLDTCTAKESSPEARPPVVLLDLCTSP